MSIGEFAIKRKYLVLSFAIAIILLGAYSKVTMKAQLAPDTNPPMATVMTRYPGASAQDVAANVSESMEEEFGRLYGIANVKSINQDNISIIQLEFNYGIDIDEAAIEVQNSVSRIRGKLPANIDEPKVLKFSTSDKPVATISLSSNSLSMEKIRQLVDDKISFDFQMLDGVASVNTFGGYNSQVKVEMDKDKMQAYGISLENVAQVLARNNIKAPGGKLTDSGNEILIRIEEGFSGTEDIEGLRIPLKDGNYVYLKDIAQISISYDDLEGSYRYKGKSAIAVMITKRTDANTIDVVSAVKGEIKELKKTYPLVNFEIAQDDSAFTLQMVNNMTSSVLMSILLTILLIMLYISTINQSLVVSISMPLVFLMTLGMMKLTGLKLDLVTLSALILSIGFVVDASIVVVENIMTHYKTFDKDIATATIDATSEIAMPTIAGALTTLTVLFPLIFIKGFVGAMFKPLSLTLIYAISSSIIIALTIIPLLTVMFHRVNLKKIERLTGYLSIPFNKLMDLILKGYVKLLKLALNNKFLTIFTALILMALSGRFLMLNGIEMLPKFDSGVSYVSIEMEPGTTLEKTEAAVSNIEKYLAQEKNVIKYDTQIGFEKDSNLIGDFGVMSTNQALLTISLNTRDKREESIWEFQVKLRNYISHIPGIKNSVVKEQGGTAVSGSSAPLNIRISGEDPVLLYQLASELEEKIVDVNGTTNVYKSFHMDNKQISIGMNHERIQEIGMNSAAISQQIYSAVEGIKNSQMDVQETKGMDIAIKYQNEFTGSLEALLDINVDTPTGMMIPLRELASIKLENRANMITREKLGYTIEILGYTDNRAFSHIVKDINNIIESYSLPNGYTAEMSGEQEELGNAMGDMMFSLALAIVFVYLLLVPQFKSFIHPITIMSAIPLVIIGIAPALALTGKYISMPVVLGIILLAGTVVNNSILLIDFAVSFREKGFSMEESLVEGVKARFRPIMMTALSDVTGMLPLAMQLALGAERFSPLAITVTGGIIAATLLTMIIIPVIYAFFEGFKTAVPGKEAVL
jgi:multidrug efflux pump subunit AcrB